MKKFKTSQKNRIAYNYYGTDGKIIQLLPGENGVTKAWIEYLHHEDDKTVDKNRREDYRIMFHLEGYKDESGEENMESHPLLEDETYNPEAVFLKNIDALEWDEKVDMLYKAMEELTEKQKTVVVKKFFEDKTNVQIAKEENVSEAAIRKSLKQAMKKLRKTFLKTGSNSF